MHVTKGDLIVLPAGLMHRFTVVATETSQRIVARRLFQAAPVWEAKNRFSDDEEGGEDASPAFGPLSLSGEEDPRTVIPMVCAAFYAQGWVSGTGGGMAIKHGNRFFMASSGVMKEKLTPTMIFVLDSEGAILEHPSLNPTPQTQLSCCAASTTTTAAKKSSGQKRAPLKLSECSPLFMLAFKMRGAGAVLHSHSMNVVMATILFGNANDDGGGGGDENEGEFVVSHQEMIKGISGHAYERPLVIPIIENTPREANLVELLESAIEAYPNSPAVMVRRHGIYVWGRDWRHAKTQAE
jgi:ribulose-5-phosphate 4-epimerase/fuculose-1-phosphate aldolase